MVHATMYSEPQGIKIGGLWDVLWGCSTEPHDLTWNDKGRLGVASDVIEERLAEIEERVRAWEPDPDD